jgi:hypothetical protein
METKAPMPQEIDLPVLQAAGALHLVLTGFGGVILSVVESLETEPPALEARPDQASQLRRLVVGVIVPALQRLESLRTEWTPET